MADQIGIVIKTEPGSYARIIADRKGACGGCQSSHSGCRSCLSGVIRNESRVVNPVNAKAGDLVKVRLSTPNLIAGLTILYLLPVFGLIIGAMAGAGILTGLGLTETSGTLIGAAVGLGLSYAAAHLLDKNKGIQKKLVPTIIRVLSSENADPLVEGKSCCD